MRAFDPVSLTTRQIAALRRASAAGAALAATAISQMTGWPLDPGVPRVRPLRLDEIARVVGGAEIEMVGLHMGVYGMSRGDLLIALDPDSARKVLGVVVPGQTAGNSLAEISPMQRSALLELGNILGGAYLSAMGSLLRGALLPSVPSLAIDMAGALLDDLLARTGRGAGSALVIEIEMNLHEEGTTARILHLPDADAIPAILEALASRPAAGISGE